VVGSAGRCDSVIEGIVLVEGPSTFVRSLPGWLILRALGSGRRGGTGQPVTRGPTSIAAGSRILGRRIEGARLRTGQSQRDQVPGTQGNPEPHGSCDTRREDGGDIGGGRR